MGIKFTSHKKEVLSALQAAKDKCLEILGGTAENYAADLAPFDTGRLSNSITHKQVDENTVAIGSDVEYAPYQELGTSRMRAQPYLRPAIENHTSEYKSIIEGELGKIGN